MGNGDENVGIEELKEQNKLLKEQIALMQSVLLQRTPPPSEPEGWLVVRSLISGHTSIIHPNIEYRGKGGDVTLSRFSEVVLPRSWQDSPNLEAGERKGIWTVTEVAERPDKLLTEPSVPPDTQVQDPLHRRMALDVALLGTDDDEGNVSSYPTPVRLFLMTDLRRESGGVDMELMQDVVRPVLDLALYLEENWRNRQWVKSLLEERITQILNLTRR